MAEEMHDFYQNEDLIHTYMEGTTPDFELDSAGENDQDKLLGELEHKLESLRGNEVRREGGREGDRSCPPGLVSPGDG